MMVDTFRMKLVLPLVLAFILAAAIAGAKAQNTSSPQSMPSAKTDKLRPTLPAMNAQRGRKVFTEKGCVVCHSINGVGGHIGPPLDTQYMPLPMDPFGFIARMWRGAAAMALMQDEVFGDVISLSGADLVDLVAFAYDAEEQKKLEPEQIPPKLKAYLTQ